MTTLTLFYDSYCPLCVKEMTHLCKKDTRQQLSFEDIHQEDFASRFPDIDAEKANQILHAVNADGHLLLGLDATYAAWQAIGRGMLIAPLRWPIISVIADKCYRWFARNRYSISYWLTGQRRCKRCSDINAE